MSKNGYVFCFFETDITEFLEECMSLNSSCFVLSEDNQDNRKRYSCSIDVFNVFIKTQSRPYEEATLRNLRVAA